jgi:large subunit ribosomal protein L23
MKQTTDILVKPLITEKSNRLTEKLTQYSFVVTMKANKLEIKKAVESMYGISVEDVSTMRMPGKNKTRYTNNGLAKGMKSAYKKAIVTCKEGDTIDFYGSI